MQKGIEILFQEYLSLKPMWYITHIIVLVLLNILIFYWWYMNLSLIFQLQVGTLISCQVPRSSLTIITAKEKRKWIETHPGGHQIFKSPENVSFFASHVFVIDYNSYNYHRPYILIMSCPIQKHSTVSINVFSQGRLTLDIRVTPYGCQPSLMWVLSFFRNWFWERVWMAFILAWTCL